jgi:hypothetical protein
MPRTYARRLCLYCGEQVSTNGMAHASHMRKHVRDGILVEMETTLRDYQSLHKDGRTDWMTTYVTPDMARHMLGLSIPGVEYRVVAGEPAKS